MKALCLEAVADNDRSATLSVEQGLCRPVACKSQEEAGWLLAVSVGLCKPRQGHVEVFGRNLYKMAEEERVLFRRRNIGAIYRKDNLLPSLNLYENLALPIGLDGRLPDLALTERLAQRAGLSDLFACLPAVLTVGQQQKAAILRAVLIGANLLLLEENFALEEKQAKDVRDYLEFIRHSFCLTAVVFGKDFGTEKRGIYE